MQIIPQLRLRFMQKHAPIRLPMPTPLIIAQHMLQALLLLLKQPLQGTQLIANIPQLQQSADIIPNLFLELAALELVPLLHAARVLARVFFVGRGAEPLGAEVFEGDGHLLDEDGDGLLEDPEDLQVAVGGALEEERHRVEGDEGGEVEGVFAAAGEIAVYFVVDAVAEVGLLVEAAFDVDWFALGGVSQRIDVHNFFFWWGGRGPCLGEKGDSGS